VDVPSIQSAAEPPPTNRPMEYGRPSYHPFTRFDPETGTSLPPTQDMELFIAGPEDEPRNVSLIHVTDERNTGAPPQMQAINLGESPWPDRFACTTAMAVVFGVLGAMLQDAPGVASTPRDLERKLMRKLLKTDIQAVRPLDPPKTRHYDDAENSDPVRDLHAFRTPS
ncbi:MAG: hypothetical protein AAFY60_07205, partial [Myxococcota bacterium]